MLTDECYGLCTHVPVCVHKLGCMQIQLDHVLTTKYTFHLQQQQEEQFWKFCLQESVMDP